MMGCSNAKLAKKPTSPLQELQFNEAKRKQQRRQQSEKKKRLKQIEKIQKRHAKKQKKVRSNRVQGYAKEQQRHDALNIRNASNLEDPTGEEVMPPSEFSHLEMYKCKDDIEQGTRRQLDRDLCGFLINQIVFTTEFFQNYENELESVYQELLDQENVYGQNLLDHSIIFANPLDKAVSRHIQYQSLHAPDVQQSSSLQTQLMYVVFENIDIARPNDANYDSISPLCKVLIETDYYRTTPCKMPYASMLREVKWKGYVRLKLRDVAKKKCATTNDDEEERTIYTDGSSGYSSSSTSDGLIMEESSDTEKLIYDYVYIESLNTHQPIRDLHVTTSNDEILANKVLPEFCVSQLKKFIEPWLEDSDDEDEVNDQLKSSHPENKMDQAQLLQQNYLNSKQFMHYFGELLSRKLAVQVNISEVQLANGTYCGCSIYTNDYEIVPAIHVAHNWPDCAFSFRIRNRPLVRHPITGQHIQWPTPSMIKRIESFGFHVIPMGYAPKRYRNPFRELEWRIVFPKAERYLEQHLTHAQVKVYMLAKALVKTFIESQEHPEHPKTLWFAFDHLRAHLFWECERNSLAWSEEFLGDKLINFLHSFMVCLRTKHLPDYFIEERNLFENIPEDSLAALHAFLNDIVEYPLMHLLMALRNLKTNDDFYPTLNLNKLFENLVEQDILKLRQLSRTTEVEITKKDLLDQEETAMQNRQLPKRTDLIKQGSAIQGDWKNYSKTFARVDPFIMKKLGGLHQHQISRNLGIENLRRTNLLALLLRHTLAMLTKATDFNNLKLAHLYLQQAHRLCANYHDLGCDFKAKDYFNEISQAEIKVKAIKDQHKVTINAIIHHAQPPALPKRLTKESSNSKTEDSNSPNKNIQNNHVDDDELKDETVINETSIEIHHKQDSVKLKSESKILQSLITRKAGEFIHTVKSSDGKINNLCDLFKRQTLKFEETLNKSSES